MTIHHHLTAHDGTSLTRGYERVVHGERGSYLEIFNHYIVWDLFHVPESQKWRVDDPEWKDKVYYIEHRSNGRSNVKLYVQKKTVNYADYKVGMCYISLDDIKEQDKTRVLAREQNEKSS